MNFYFYCPNCGTEYDINQLPRGTVANCRDGYGYLIYHYECSKCGNLDAGFMRINEADPNWKRYCQEVIGLYQNIRGINKKD